MSDTEPDCTHVVHIQQDGPHDAESCPKLQAAQSSAVRRGNQKCLHFENYITQHEWIEHRATTLDAANEALIARRAVKINLFYPSEPTLYRMVSILAYVKRDPNKTQDDVTRHKTNIKKMIKGALGKGNDHAYLDTYPLNPADLPPSIIASAYGNIPPVCVCFAELDTILGTNKMRRSGPKLPAWMEHVPVQMRAAICAALPDATLQVKPSPPRVASQVVAMPAEAQGPDTQILATTSTSNSYGACSLAFRSVDQSDASTPRAPKRALVKVEVLSSDEEPHAEGADVLAASAAASKAAVAARNKVEQMEQELMEKASKPALRKRPAAGLTRSCAHVPKPASCLALGQQMDDLLEDMTANISSFPSRGAFVTKAFKAAESAVLREGQTPEEAKAYAREVYARAAKLWSEAQR